jgi:RNA-directed DNA polymerase
MATGEEPEEVPGRDSSQDAAHERPEPEGHIGDLNRTLKGWFEYFKHSHKTTFPSEDGWVRGRLRSLLRKRQGRKGRARGDDHHRWPNRFFTEQGLFSLNTTHAQVCQSLPR